jgi:hypothetical protein
MQTEEIPVANASVYTGVVADYQIAKTDVVPF